MKDLIISCPTLQGELEAALKKYGNEAEVHYLPARLHAAMGEIRPTVQKYLDGAQPGQRVFLLVSGCGGSTQGLQAVQGDLVIPRTHDCLDILLADAENCRVPKRDPLGMYMTGSWYEYHMQTLLNADAQVAAKGYAQASKELRAIFKNFNHFYIIDTGCFDVRAVQNGLRTLVEILQGSVQVLPGEYGFLQKLAAGEVKEQYFYILHPGERVPFLPFRLEDSIMPG